MTIGISTNYSSYGTLGVLIADSVQVKGQLDTLAQQVGDGLKATTYAGLGNAAQVSLTLTPQISALQTYQNNISAVTGQMSVTQTAITQLQQIASTFADKMPDLNNLNPSEIDSIAADARDALDQVADLLNTRDGNIYVFAGQDSANPPVPSGDQILSSGFYQQINAAVTQLGTNGAAATTAATQAIASSNAAGTSPFSGYLSQPASQIGVPSVDAGNGTRITVGIVASTNTAVQSTGSSTTGSYMRDLLRALATIGSMSSTQGSDPNFSALVQDTSATLNGVVTAMGQDAGVMGDRQTALTKLSATLSQTSTALSGQVSSAQDVDMATTLSQLTQTQTQLAASYKLISTMNSMSIVNYL